MVLGDDNAYNHTYYSICVLFQLGYTHLHSRNPGLTSNTHMGPQPLPSFTIVYYKASYLFLPFFAKWLSRVLYEVVCVCWLSTFPPWLLAQVFCWGVVHWEENDHCWSGWVRCMAWARVNWCTLPKGRVMRNLRRLHRRTLVPYQKAFVQQKSRQSM